VKQAILKHLYDFPGTQGSNVFRAIESDFIDLKKRTVYYHIKLMKDWDLIEELTERRPFPLQLTWPGKQCVQLSSVGLTDKRWVRLEKAYVQFDIIELYVGNLEDFKESLLLSGKWGKVSSVTHNNWTKVIIKSVFPFFRGGTLEFRFGKYPKFCIYLSTSHGKSSEQAKDRAMDQARYLENRFQNYFDRAGLEIVDKDFNWTGETSTAEYESPSRVDVERHVTIKDGKYWFDRSHGYPEMGVRSVQQAERQFSVPDQIDELKEDLNDLKDYMYSVENRLADNQQMLSRVVFFLEKKWRDQDQ